MVGVCCLHVGIFNIVWVLAFDCCNLVWRFFFSYLVQVADAWPIVWLHVWGILAFLLCCFIFICYCYWGLGELLVARWVNYIVSLF